MSGWLPEGDAPLVTAMINGGPTAPLDEFVAAYERDDNIWWVIGSGHHQNLFDAATERVLELKQRADTVAGRVEALLNAEEIVLRAQLSRQERACRKATRDAYALVLDLMSEGDT